MPKSTPVPIRDHTKLLNIGSLNHATIDGYLDQAVKQASSPAFAYLKLTTAPSVGYVYTCSNIDGTGGWAAPVGGGVTDHGALTGLSDDDHTQYALLLGRTGGQTLIGGTAASENLTLQSTAHATRGNILFGTSAYDGVNNRLGIAVATPLAGIHNAFASIVSVPANLLSGTWFTGGTATTTKPHLLIEPTGTTSTAWSTSGTGLGVNAASGFAGDLIDLQLAGATKFRVDKDGYIKAGLFDYFSTSASGVKSSLGFFADNNGSFYVQSGGTTHGQWSTKPGDGLHLGIQSVNGGANNNFIFTTFTNIGGNYAHALSADPTLFIHSSTAATSATTQWVSIAHNQTNAIFSIGLGNFNFVGNVDSSGYFSVDGTQVVSNRVIDVRIDDTINDTLWDSTTAGVLDAVRDACITHGLIAPS
jgi:hypothetical protein